MKTTVPEIMTLLAHHLRWQIVSRLALSDHRVGEIVSFTSEPQNLVSYHLKKLRESQLVNERRSSADKRDVYYSLDLELLRTELTDAGSALHPFLRVSDTAQTEIIPAVRVLFLCTHNSARSQMAEALLRKASEGSIAAFSAGTEPSVIHSMAIRALESLGVSSKGQYSKSLDALGEHNFDYVVTVCDRARELCPTYPHETKVLHWSIADPSEVQGTLEKRYQVFQDTAAALQIRIRHLISLIQSHQHEKRNPVS